MTKVLLAALALIACSFPLRAADQGRELLDAVKSGDHAAMRRLLAQGANPNSVLPDNSTVLAWAVDRQNPESVRLLLSAGATPNFADLDGATPLILACELGDPTIIEMLLNAHANVKANRSDGVTALELCAGSTKPAVLERLIRAGGEADAPDVSGQTPLMWAAAQANVDNFGFLLKHGAKVNRASKGGFTPLFFAIKSGSAEALQAVLAAGGDPGYVAPDGTNAPQLAVYWERLDFARQLVGDKTDLSQWDQNGQQLLHAAVTARDLEFAKLLLSRGANPNALTGPSKIVKKKEPNAGGGVLAVPAPKSPLLLAAAAGSVEMMKLLIEAGAEPAFKASDGTNVLLAAAAGGRLDALQYALQLAPDVNVVTGRGQSALRIARSSARTPEGEAMVMFLIEHGAKTDSENTGSGSK